MFKDTFRQLISDLGRSFDRVPHSFLNYPSLCLLWLGIRPAWLRRSVASSEHMICFQLVDEVYTRAGLSIFDDRRPAQDVTPGELDAYRIADLEQLAAVL